MSMVTQLGIWSMFYPEVLLAVDILGLAFLSALWIGGPR